MTSSSIFLLQAFVIVAAPVVLLRISGLKGVLSLVVVQIAVGVMLGPAVFGKLAPDWFHTLSTPAVQSQMSGLAAVGVLFFGLTAGLHVDLKILTGKDRAFWPTAAANFVAPMILGFMAGAWILKQHPAELLPGVPPVGFIVAIGICVSMSAIPVLGAILGEMGLLGSRIGSLALGIAGFNDMLQWTALAAILTVVAASRAGDGSAMASIYLVVATPAYLFFMVRIARPVLSDLVESRMLGGTINARALVVVGAVTIASALVTELMGLHYLIGAFVVGAIIPTQLRQPIIDRLYVMTVAVLMPFFFAQTGMRIPIGEGSLVVFEVWSIATTVAAIGIIGGVAVAARLAGESWSFALGLGSLMQTKGLTELIVLTILLDAQIISPRIFTAMICMALLSASMTLPLARLALTRKGEPLPIGAAFSYPDQKT